MVGGELSILQENGEKFYLSIAIRIPHELLRNSHGFLSWAARLLWFQFPWSHPSSPKKISENPPKTPSFQLDSENCFFSKNHHLKYWKSKITILIHFAGFICSFFSRSPEPPSAWLQHTEGIVVQTFRIIVTAALFLTKKASGAPSTKKLVKHAHIQRPKALQFLIVMHHVKQSRSNRGLPGEDS